MTGIVTLLVQSPIFSLLRGRAFRPGFGIRLFWLFDRLPNPVTITLPILLSSHDFKILEERVYLGVCLLVVITSLVFIDLMALNNGQLE
jgi:hypothetical protein